MLPPPVVGIVAGVGTKSVSGLAVLPGIGATFTVAVTPKTATVEGSPILRGAVDDVNADFT